uniref:GAGA-binding transcriptional activator n=1 Tax=Artemisia annua TaxID=35608 RepID=H1ZN69_ARTAN|nr:GAGA-binding transcriptional activator [Artemisia annua]
MDDDGLNIRNWGYYEPPSFKEHLGLQLMSPMIDHRDTKPFLSPREHPIMVNPNGVMPYHHNHLRNSVVNESPLPMQYMRDGWIQRDRHHHMHPGNNNYPLIHDSSGSQSMHMMHQLDPSKNHGMMMEDSAECGGGDSGSGGSGSGVQLKRRSGPAVTNPKQPRAKKPRKTSSIPKENGNPSGRSKTVKRSMDVVINGIDMDISGIPIPVCSCTGVQQQCYRWGSGGWQSACCTTTISMYPLPMSTKRRGARIAGRKMSQGAFKKVLEKLASESYNFANAIDLRLHWAKHGTNKFVTIR